MKYLNKNIEEIVKKENTKSLINHTTSCGVFQKSTFNSPFVKKQLKKL